MPVSYTHLDVYKRQELYTSLNRLVAIETKSGVARISTDEIIYIEATGRNVTLHTKDVYKRQVLNTYQETLDSPTKIQYFSENPYPFPIPSDRLISCRLLDV